MIANTEGLELVESFEVNWKDLFAVHATIQFTIHLDALEEKKKVVNRAESFYAKLSEKVRGEFKYQPDDVFKKEAWDRWHDLLGNTHSYMTEQLNRHTDVLHTILTDRGTTSFWNCMARHH